MSDDISKQIDSLIVETPDPKDKALLLILKKISDNLEDNTNLTRTLTGDLKAHTDAFQEHEKEEMALINQGRGFLRAAVAGLAFVQITFAWYFQEHIAEAKAMYSQIQKLNEYRAEHVAHHEQEKETYKAFIYKK